MAFGVKRFFKSSQDDEKTSVSNAITLGSTLTEEEREVLRLLYHEDMPGGLPAAELQTLLSNILVLEK